MNYTQSKKILAQVKKAQRILVNCHRAPDPDSIGSALAMKHALNQMGKYVEIICPTSVDARMNFLPDYKDIMSEVDFETFDFAQYDLLLALDSADWSMVSRVPGMKLPEIPVCVIDHHWTNTKYGKYNLVDHKISSVGELLYLVFEDWRIKIDKNIANALLTAIIGDTGIFKFTNTTSQTLFIVSQLMEKGADKDKIIFELYRSLDADMLAFVGEALKRVVVDTRNKFVWSAVPYRIFRKYSKPEEGKDLATHIFAAATDKTKFGFMLLEVNKGKYSISFRAREDDVDVSKLAQALGGGGHKVAAGGGSSLEGKEFDDAVKLTLKAARKFAREENL